MEARIFLRIVLGLLLVVQIKGDVTKSNENKKTEKMELSLPPEGLIMNILVKNRETRVPVARVKIDINEQNKKVVLSLSPEPPPTVTPSVDNRMGISGGSCPKGYTQAGGFCFKEDYDY